LREHFFEFYFGLFLTKKLIFDIIEAATLKRGEKMNKTLSSVVGIVGLFLLLTGCGFASKIVGCPFLSERVELVALPNLERGPAPLDVQLAIDLRNAVGLQEVSYLVDWGDGKSESIYLPSLPSKNPYSKVVQHRYEKEGNYEVKVRSKICDREVVGRATIVVEPSVKPPLDSDGDGITDQFDQCPFVKGQPPTGCPLPPPPPPPPPPQEPTLVVNVDLDPPVIQAGNSVLVTVRVGGTAKGSITYMVDCAVGVGAEFNIITTSESPLVGECPYLEPGTYTIKVRVLREGLKREVIKVVEVLAPPPPPRLELQGTFTPQEGTAPLAVSVVLLLLGTAEGPTRLWIDCQNDGRWDQTFSLGPENIWDGKNICRYERGGNYRLNIKAERQGVVAFIGGDIEVFESPQLDNLFATLDVWPTAGSPPLEVSVKVTVNGGAGQIVYRIDCTSDGTWEEVIETSSTTITKNKICNYTKTETLTVEVTRNSQTVRATATVIVQ
jgi:hypothetical protein